ncbi:RNA polymerase sigma factor [Variovorax sp. E3]|uniref:RNA polymerase sigma factor n=1 Tax=Variovorax sp. E3 TaxID=1914993 RepID=UPI0018DE851E|nr:RNA polymerase sigma factor [Variovorax sp. E3]
MTTDSSDSDDALLVRVGRGEPQAMREMVARKLPRMVALGVRFLGRRSEAEEVAQEVFLRVWKQAADWQPGQARFDTWLHRVAMNLCYDRLRGRHDEATDDALDDAPDPGPAPDEALQAAQRGARLAAALKALPTRQREALVLQYYQELSNQEAATVMGVTVEALESLLSRARRALRAQLQPGGDLRNEKP